MAKILLDVNVLLDAFLGRQENAKKLIDELVKTDHDLFITSSMILILDYFLNKYGADKKKFKDIFFSRFKIITTTGYEGLKAFEYKDTEKALIFLSFKRAVGKGIIITSDKSFEADGLKILTPEEALTSPEIFSNLSNELVPMLDLKKEYHYSIEEIDHVVLKNIAEAKYILGPEVKELEEKIAQYIGVKHCIGCSSGTEALVLSLRALAIKLKKQEYFDKADEIITTPFTFTATGDAILRSGATPVFVDIDLDTYTIDPEKIREYLSQNPKVVGIIPVHLYGHPANMDEIMEIARENNLFVVEDVAQAFGSRWSGKKLGSIGTTGCFSFFPSKNLGGFGDGGMVSTNDDELAEISRMLIKHGGKDKYNVDHVGYNARLDTIQAAIILAKFDIIDDFNERRRKIAKLYTEGLKEIQWLKTPIEKEKAYHVFHQYTILLKDKNRDELQENLKQKGISTMVYYPYPLHKMKVFINNGMKVHGDLQNSEYAAKNVLSLPIEPLYDEKIIYKVIDGLSER
jgi:dTDP-4-amino-4,6-dideoxygalactose transaminase/predicted nucleic acid-binding protein